MRSRRLFAMLVRGCKTNKYLEGESKGRRKKGSSDTSGMRDKRTFRGTLPGAVRRIKDYVTVSQKYVQTVFLYCVPKYLGKLERWRRRQPQAAVNRRHFKSSLHTSILCIQRA